MAALMGKTVAAAEKLEGQSSAQVARLLRSHRIFAARIPPPLLRRLEDIDAEIPVARRRKEERVLN